MRSISRRQILLAFGLAPVAAAGSVPIWMGRRQLTVAEALRFLCTDVFPSPSQRRDTLRHAATKVS